MHPLSATQFPRLLYAGDVPIEATAGGSVLLHRLLTDYPPEQLLVVEGSHMASRPERRLPQVAYRKLRAGVRRLLHTRFAAPYSNWLACTALLRVKPLTELADLFKPDAVLTVAHGFSWVTAAEF